MRPHFVKLCNIGEAVDNLQVGSYAAVMRKMVKFKRKMGVALRAKNCYNPCTVWNVPSMYVFAPERQGKTSDREVFEAGTKFGEGCSCVLHEVVGAFVPVEIIYVLARSQNTF